MRRAFLAFAIASFTTLLGANTLSSVGSWRAGVHYSLVEAPQAPTAASGKVEVNEFFWYGCRHCYALDPVLEEWSGRKAGYIEFVRVPVIWGPENRQHARLYYTLQALKRMDLHGKVFDAIHQEGMQLTHPDELRARDLQAEFLAGFGIARPQFDAAFNSMMVAVKLQRAEQATRALRVDNVPTLFVNGKYSTSVGEAGGEAQLLSLIDELAASEHP